MTMSNARNVVDQYFTALTRKDFTAMRNLLHDDLSFKGPLATIDNADDSIGGMKHVAANMTGAERRTVFGEGEDVCQVYDLFLATPAVTVPVAQWLKVRDNRIAKIELFCDARPFVQPPPS